MEFGRIKLTHEHFLTFSNAAKAYVDFFGITDWSISYFFVSNSEKGDDSDACAYMQVCCFENRTAVIALCDSWLEEPTDYRLCKSAFHEVLELLFADIHAMAGDREWNEDKYDREHHRIIRIFESSVFFDMWRSEHGLFDFQSPVKTSLSEG